MTDGLIAVDASQDDLARLTNAVSTLAATNKFSVLNRYAAASKEATIGPSTNSSASSRGA
jgi:hypothetical protein